MLQRDLRVEGRGPLSAVLAGGLEGDKSSLTARDVVGGHLHQRRDPVRKMLALDLREAPEDLSSASNEQRTDTSIAPVHPIAAREGQKTFINQHVASESRYVAVVRFLAQTRELIRALSTGRRNRLFCSTLSRRHKLREQPLPHTGLGWGLAS